MFIGNKNSLWVKDKVNELGLISYYRLDGDATDAVSVNDGNETSIVYTAGVNGQAADFDGTNTPKIEVWSLTDDFSFTDGITDKPFSISYFVKFKALNNTYFISKRLYSSTDREYNIIYLNGEFSTLLYDGTTSAYLRKYANIAPVINTWYYVTMTYDGSGAVDGINMYINGVNDNGRNETSGIYTAMAVANTPLDIGNPTWSTIYTLNGIIDGVGVFNKELTPSEVLSNYNLQLTQELA